MIKNTFLKYAFSSVLLLALTACGGSSTDDTTTDNTTDNLAPVVDAGLDQTVDEGASVTLNLTVTDDDTVTVTWLQQSGVSVILSDTSANSPTF
ncbi:hypothetical protein H4J50_11335, partial [Colwellia sp. 6M3]|nr:hypothetical protein [Colwellia sp. 6M3]